MRMIKQRGQEVREAARVTGINIDLDAHAGSQRRHTGAARVDARAQRNALHDLYPVAAGVLRRQQLELLRGRRADALDSAVPLLVRISVDRHREDRKSVV